MYTDIYGIFILLIHTFNSLFLTFNNTHREKATKAVQNKTLK